MTESFSSGNSHSKGRDMHLYTNYNTKQTELQRIWLQSQMEPGAGSDSFYLWGSEKIWQKRLELSWASNNAQAGLQQGD